MNLDEIKGALTRKYGPLPGYAWAGIGAAAIVVIAGRRGGGSTSSAPAFLTTPPQDAISTGLDGAGGGGGSDGNVDPAVGYGEPSITPEPVVEPTSVTPASSSAPSIVGLTPDAAIAQGVNASDYFAANPLPQGTSTADALSALSQFPAQTYDFSYQGPPMPAIFSAEPSISSTNTPPAITTDPHPAAPAPAPAPVVASSPPSMIELHYLHGRDPDV